MNCSFDGGRGFADVPSPATTFFTFPSASITTLVFFSSSYFVCRSAMASQAARTSSDSKSKSSSSSGALKICFLASSSCCIFSLVARCCFCNVRAQARSSCHKVCSDGHRWMATWKDLTACRESSGDAEQLLCNKFGWWLYVDVFLTDDWCDNGICAPKLVGGCIRSKAWASFCRSMISLKKRSILFGRLCSFRLNECCITTGVQSPDQSCAFPCWKGSITISQCKREEGFPPFFGQKSNFAVIRG